VSLNWSATECDPKALSKEEKNLTEYFCFVLMDVGIPVLTKDNYEEAYERVKLGEVLNGCWFSERPLRVADFKLRVGYRTNVSPLTRNQYEKKALKIFWEDQARLKRLAQERNEQKLEVA
jgi:hypothetical protein|tara:strand:+ start:783 stop:1142 length:360 start_codon:yes stop_codon:yes gene_type:complete